MTIKEMRKAKGYTQEQASELLGVKQSYYSRIERGAANPTVRKLVDLSRLYERDIEEVVREFVTEEKRCFLSLLDGLQKHLHVTLPTTPLAPAHA